MKMNGFARTIALGMAIAAGTMASVSVASATTWNFGGAFGSLGPDEVFTVGPDSLTAAAFTYAEPAGVATYTASTLLRRNEAPDDIGLGVCNSGDGAGCTTITSGNGDNNEIDNNGSLRDLIRLDLGSSKTGLSVTLASVDGLTGNVDNYAIYVSNSATAKLSTLTALTGSQSGGGVNPTVNITGSWRYIFVTTGSGINGDDDFLLKSATASSAVPEPASLLLMGSGLAGLAVWRLRRKSN
jgi:PEP-CTERM motif